MTATFPAVRLRRLRGSATLRDMLAEISLEPRHLMLPLFATSGTGVREPVPALDDVFRVSVDRLPEIVEPALDLGVRSFLLFGIPTHKDSQGSAASEDHQPVQNALRDLRRRYPEALLASDVCLCQYTDHGHCGILNERQEIDNDQTLDRLGAIAVSHAEAGAHIVAPSDMMDGRAGRLRAELDEGGFSGVGIMSYAIKMYSVFYGPFREAADSAPRFGDRRSYQMPPTNTREALREACLDEAEGADLLIVKPALTSLDVVARLRDRTLLPVVGYLVSGEYMMLRTAADRGCIDGDRAMLEAHLACRRAGCDLLITYAAMSVAHQLRKLRG